MIAAERWQSRLAMAERKDTNAMSERLSALEKQLTQLKRQNSDMARALEAAGQRVRELEAARDQAMDHIDWAIDSLHTVVDREQ
jgi:predicted RNase H-like nuclease (RuvC/YqgF family)